MRHDEDPASAQARALALLWGAQDKPSRGPKQGLSIDAIVRAAVELADADGLAALSMRKVADKLGVGAMTLYTYVPGKDELVGLMVDAVQRERADTRTLDGGWREKLEAVARDLWDICHRHMWLLQAGSERTPIGPNTMEAYESELAAVADAGLTTSEMVSVVSLVTGYVHGAVRASVQVIQEERRTGMTREEWWRETGPLLDKYIDYSRYPIVTSTGDAEAHADGPAEVFEFGLARVLDGIEVLISSRR